MKIFSFIRRQIAPLVVLCCFVFFGSQSAAAQYNKIDPGNNNPPPAGAIKDLSGTPIPGGGNNTYQNYTVDFTAGIANTAITFAFREDPAFISFSNASVVDLANPSVNLLVNGDFSQGPVGSNTPTGWTYANQYGATFGGQVVLNCGVGPNGQYGVGPCWNDGAVQAYDAISQTIATIVGHTYRISFWVADNSGCRTGPPFPDGLCEFSDLSTNGNTTTTGGNGINVTVYAQGGLPPSGSTTKTSPPETFSSGGNTTVPFIFNQNQGTYDEHDEVFPQGGNINCPIGCATGQLQVQDTETAISNDPVWSTFVGGTPWGPSKIFPLAANGDTNTGSMYTIQCFDANHPPAPGQCPEPINPGPGSHVSAKLAFDLPTGVQPPPIDIGTTVALLHYPPITPGWSSSSMLPNPGCKNVFTATFDCPTENTLVVKYGKSNGFGTDTKNGSYALVYRVPMPCSAWFVNGKSVNTQCVQGNSTFFVRSPLTFDFQVTPAQLPAGFTIQGFTNIARTGGNTVTITMSAVPTAWTNGTTLAIKPDDKTNFPPVSAVISNRTAITFQYTQAGSNVATGSPPTGTVDDVNGWVAAPVDKLFYHFDPFPGPDYPNYELLRFDENLNDLDNCSANSPNCPVAGTSPAQPGTSSTLPVEFKTVPVPVPTEGIYKLQVSSKDTVNDRELNVQVLTAGQCTDPFPNDANRPVGGWMPPCFSTELFYATIIVDNTAPTVTTNPSGSFSAVLNGPSPTLNFTCTDPPLNSGGAGSGIKVCGISPSMSVSNPGISSFTGSDPLSTATSGTTTITVYAQDVAGNTASTSVNYTVVPYNAFVQQPINADGSSIFNAKRGVIPVKFTITKDNVATCALPPAMIALSRTAGGTLGAIDESVYEMAADNGSNFRISGCQYIYNLASSSLGPGAYRVDIIISGVVVGSGVFALK